MIVVAIIGILAAIAIPAYQDYTIRAKMSEPISFADAAKTSVSEYFQTKGKMPADASTAGVNESATSQYIGEVAYAPQGNSTATITITVTNVGGSANGDQIVFTGTGKDSGTVEWTCSGAGGMPQKYLPASCRD
jgi:type IV pilus assembly protein PilA